MNAKNVFAGRSQLYPVHLPWESPLDFLIYLSE